MRVVNDVVLFFFNVCAFHDGPIRSVHPMSSAPNDCLRGFIATFFIALSGPLVVFLFVNLFTHFSFIVPNDPVNFRLIKCLTVMLKTLL